MSNPRHSFRRLIRTSAVLTVLLGLVSAGSTAFTASTTVIVPPPNDNFSDAQPILGRSGIVFGNNSGATRETNEAFHAKSPGGASVWYKWQAPETGRFVSSTSGSTFATSIAVYTGTSLLT